MWYFTWILGLGFALAFGVINAIWFEILEPDKTPPGTDDKVTRQP
jgi:cytochrome bd-I ubiquinol oxidase subunit X